MQQHARQEIAVCTSSALKIPPSVTTGKNFTSALSASHVIMTCSQIIMQVHSIKTPALSHHNSATACQLPEDVSVPQAVQQYAWQQIAGSYKQRPKDHPQQHQGQKALQAEVRSSKAKR